MFVGGVLPACAGQLTQLLSRSFWRQSFVTYAVGAELALGLHDLMLSGTSYSSPQQQQQQQQQQAGLPAASGTLDGAGVASAVGAEPSHGSDDSAESFEFFVWSRCSFIVTFCALYLGNSSLYAELLDMFSGRVAHKYVYLSVISEGLTIVGFYLASIAYGLFYQAGIVHAAEASLSQLFNLLIAFLMLRVFNIGRSSAVSSMSIKLVSFVMVTIGLFLCTIEPERAPHRISEAAKRAELRHIVPYEPGLAPVDGDHGAMLGTPSATQQAATAAIGVATQAAQRMLRRRRRL